MTFGYRTRSDDYSGSGRTGEVEDCVISESAISAARLCRADVAEVYSPCIAASDDHCTSRKVDLGSGEAGEEMGPKEGHG